MWYHDGFVLVLCLFDTFNSSNLFFQHLILCRNFFRFLFGVCCSVFTVFESFFAVFNWYKLIEFESF